MKKNLSKEPIERRINSWLTKQGYNLEMLTAREFQQQGFKVAQSVHYLDTDQKTTREIDVICYYSKMIQNVSFNITFVIECKKSNDKPWLVFKSNAKAKRYQSWDEIEGTDNALILLEEIKNAKKKRGKVIDFLAYEDTTLGYGVTQAFTSGIDVTYAATTTALKAIRYFVEKYRNHKVRLCSLYFPLIVVDGKLFDIELETNSELKITEVPQTKFVQMRSDLNRTNIIQIVTKDNLKQFCSDLKMNCERFIKLYSKEIKAVLDKHPNTNQNTFGML